MDAIPVNDLKPLTLPLATLLRKRIDEVLDACWFLEGRQISEFEAEFATYIGCDHAVAVANGTDAIELALRAAGVGDGDEVVTVANAGGYTTTACMAINAVPHYADIDPDSLLLSIDRLTECLTHRTKAVVITHLYGRVVDVPRVRAVVGPNIALIEDCAQAHGAMLDGCLAGSMGDFATFSFYPTKNLGALGDAGMVLAKLTGSDAVLRTLKQYGWSSRYHVALKNGRNTRMDEIQAAILRAKLPYLDGWNAERRAIAAAYDAAFDGTAFRCFRGNHTGNVHHLYVVRHPERDRVRERFERLGVGTTIHYPVLDCDQPGLAGVPMATADLRNSREATKEILTLPCYPGLAQELVDQVVAAIREVASL